MRSNQPAPAKQTVGFSLIKRLALLNNTQLGGSMKTVSFLFLLILNSQSSVAQWTTPRAVDTAVIGFSPGRVLLCIAVGPQREVAVVPLRTDTLVCYFSNDNGRSFSRSIVDFGWRSGFAGGYVSNVDGAGFDSHSNLFILWRMIKYDDVVAWYSFRLSKSTDGGRTFSLFWATPYFGGLTTSSLIKGALAIDSDDRVHCVWDSAGFGFAYMYTRLSGYDSSDRHQTMLPTLPVSGLPASVALLVRGGSVDVALSAKKEAYPRAALYHLCSSDTGATFPSTAPVDTLNARSPTLVRQSSGELLLVHTSAPMSPPSSYDDSALVVRQKIDSLFSEPLLLVGNLGAGDDPITVRSRDSTLTVAYTRYQPAYGVSYYHMRKSGGLPIDTLFLPGHHSPDLAIDSLGGEYLVSVYQNRIYLSTRDVQLGVTENQGGLPYAFSLGQNFPNPFNPRTKIPYEIYRSGMVEIIIYDLLGRELTRLVNEMKTPGSYLVEWDATNMASGVYLYSLRVTGIVQSRRMILIK